MLISQTTAQRFWPQEDPLGKRVRLGGADGKLRTIVGIVPDVLHKKLDDGPDLQAYVPHAQGTDSFMLLAVRTTADPAGAIAAIRQAVSAVDKDIPIFQIATMEHLIATSTAQRRFTMLLASIFAGLSLVLAGLGIYSVIAYTVAQRAHEIGIRLALGAQTRDVLWLVVRQGLALTLIGVVLGLVAALALTRVLQNMLYGVSATDPATFAGIALLLISVAFIASFIPARRATNVDPLVALRHD